MSRTPTTPRIRTASLASSEGRRTPRRIRAQPQQSDFSYNEMDVYSTLCSPASTPSTLRAPSPILTLPASRTPSPIPTAPSTPRQALTEAELSEDIFGPMTAELKRINKSLYGQ
jgi:hypothetical protein